MLMNAFEQRLAVSEHHRANSADRSTKQLVSQMGADNWQHALVLGLLLCASQLCTPASELHAQTSQPLEEVCLHPKGKSGVCAAK